jgi:hypothetical protein
MAVIIHENVFFSKLADNWRILIAGNGKDIHAWNWTMKYLLIYMIQFFQMV